MDFFSELEARLVLLREMFGGEFDACDLPVVVEGLGDDAVVAALVAATELVHLRPHASGRRRERAVSADRAPARTRSTRVNGTAPRR